MATVIPRQPTQRRFLHRIWRITPALGPSAASAEGVSPGFTGVLSAEPVSLSLSCCRRGAGSAPRARKLQRGNASAGLRRVAGGCFPRSQAGVGPGPGESEHQAPDAGVLMLTGRSVGISWVDCIGLDPSAARRRFHPRTDSQSVTPSWRLTCQTGIRFAAVPVTPGYRIVSRMTGSRRSVRCWYCANCGAVPVICCHAASRAS